VRAGGLDWRAGIAVDIAAAHDRIAAALVAGDPDAAAEAMRAHLLASRDRLIRFTAEI
jgi:DNA-binding FadR family transcriptional regulator